MIQSDVQPRAFLALRNTPLVFERNFLHVLVVHWSSILDSSLLGSAKTEILFESTRHPQLTRGQRGPGGTSPAAAKAQP